MTTFDGLLSPHMCSVRVETNGQSDDARLTVAGTDTSDGSPAAVRFDLTREDLDSLILMLETARRVMREERR